MKFLRIEEPQVEFGLGQSCDDPRDGLTLFGPYERASQVRAGVIGTSAAIALFRHWEEQIHAPTYCLSNGISRPFFPGFNAAFHVDWIPGDGPAITLSEHELTAALTIRDPKQRVSTVADMFVSKLLNFARTQEQIANVWFIVIPRELKLHATPLSAPLSPSDQTLRYTGVQRSSKYGTSIDTQYLLLDDEKHLVDLYHYKADFRKQIKAKLLRQQIVTQIVLEDTLERSMEVPRPNAKGRILADMRTAILWNLTTAAYYKCGGKPWKLAHVRPGVCYIGIAFKKLEQPTSKRNACCAAQMFLENGDGVVFKGAEGPWLTDDAKEFHLSRQAAHDLISSVTVSYAQTHGRIPSELFLHSFYRFNQEELEGFRIGVDPFTKINAIRIRKSQDIRLFTLRRSPVLRGSAVILDESRAFLCTNGFIPRLQTQQGTEMPLPLEVEKVAGQTPLDTILADLMALTKLNYNACIFSDGLPVTLRFADAVGDILVTGPLVSLPPLPFRHYI